MGAQQRGQMIENQGAGVMMCVGIQRQAGSDLCAAQLCARSRGINRGLRGLIGHGAMESVC